MSQGNCGFSFKCGRGGGGDGRGWERRGMGKGEFVPVPQNSPKIKIARTTIHIVPGHQNEVVDDVYGVCIFHNSKKTMSTNNITSFKTHQT